ncbi:hypothetical protein Tco_0930000 [Tanacetum coccineum]
MFPPVPGSNNSSDPVILKSWIPKREGRLTGSARRFLEGALLALWGSPFGSHNRRQFPHKDGANGNRSVHNPWAIKFHTPKGIGTVLSTYESPERDERKKKPKATCSEIAKNVLSCGDAEERIIVNTKYPEQTIAIGKKLPTNIKERLQKLLIANIDVFAWTYADMTGIPRTIMVGGKSFNTMHKLNEYKHIKHIKKKRRGLGFDRNEALCREVEKLTKA